MSADAVREDRIATFVEAIDEIGIETTRCAASEATEAIEAAVEGTAVGSPLPFDDVELPASVDAEPTREAIERANTGVTAGTFAIAEYGTVVVAPTPDGEGTVSLYPPRHVAVVRASDVVSDMPAAFDRLAEEFEAGRNDAIFVTGPSTTGDMGALVRGVHGPAEMYVIVVEDEP